MTEQDFRDALKRQVGQTGLSSDRQYKVLAGMKGGQRKVRTWSKMKIALVLAALVVLTMGVAAATEIVKYVNWDGEPVDYEAPAYAARERAADELRDPIAEELIANKKPEEILQIYYPGQEQAARIGTSYAKVTSLEELYRLGGEGGPMPLPVNIPEGFTLSSGYMYFGPDQDASYQYLGEEVYDAEVRVKRYACDPDDLYVYMYALYFVNQEGEILNFFGNLRQNDGQEALLANDARVEVLEVPEMEHVVYIDHGNRAELWIRDVFPEPVDFRMIYLNSNGVRLEEAEQGFSSMEIQIFSTLCDADAMLACFGLTAR